MAAHRFWRLYIDTKIPGNFDYDAIGFLDFYDGATLLTNSGGTVAASSQYASFAPSRIWNGGPGLWVSNNQTPCWVSYDFGAGVTHNVTSFVITPNNYGNYPATFGIEYSDDGAAWNRQASFVPPEGGWVNGQPVTYAVASPGTDGIEASEARTFSVFAAVAANELMSSARVFSVYNFPTPFMYDSAARVILPVKRNSDMEISESRVFAVVRGRIADPKVRAWTFTLDGHDFYVLRLGDGSTIVYDDYSEQWTDWDSKGNGAWRPNTGFQWLGAQGIVDSTGKSYGSTIVAGDDLFGLLWFLDPEQPYDDNPDAARIPQQVDFERVVTGQVLGSGRVETPCYVVFVDGDNYGLTGTEFTPGVTLEYSDDQGRNFVSAETLPSLIDPSENNPYAWYSLGQISSPGRIFRVRDNGVFARIDSMDMNDDAG